MELTHYRLLIADDDDSLRETLKDVLSRFSKTQLVKGWARLDGSR